MSQSNSARFAINALSNWALNVVQALVGLLIGRIGVAQLGAENFGLYNLLNTVVGFLTLFDLGLSATMFRFAAQYQAAGDHVRLRQSASTTFVLFLSLGLLGCGLMLLGEPWLAEYFRVTPELRDGFFAINFCLALSFALRFASLTDAGLLIGASRYDLMNGVDIVANLLRIALLLVLFEVFEPSLWLFGLTFIAPQLIRLVGLRGLVRYYVIRRPLLRLQWVRLSELRTMSGFGSLNALNLLGWLLITELPNIILGRLLGPAAVTAFYAPKLISTLLRTLVVGLCNPLIPLAGRDAVTNEGRSLSHWSIRLSRLAAILAIAIALPTCILARPLLTIWLGPDYAWTAPILIAAVIGQVFAGIQAANFYLLLGGGRIGFVAYSQIVCVGLAVAGAVGGHYQFGWGVFGITAVFAGVLAVWMGLYLPIMTARQFHTPLTSYFWHAYALPLGPALLAGPLAFGLAEWLPPASWFDLIWQGGLCVLVYLGGTWRLALTPEDRALLGRLTARFR